MLIYKLLTRCLFALVSVKSTPINLVKGSMNTVNTALLFC